MSVLGNPLMLGGSGGGGGTVTITDTTDAAGGTIRTITPSPNTTTIMPLSVTSNNTYTAPTGYAYSPVTVNVSGGGGLEYEEGTFTPTSAVSSKTISFSNAHTSPPYFIMVYDADGTTSTPSNYTIIGWAFQYYGVKCGSYYGFVTSSQKTTGYTSGKANLSYPFESTGTTTFYPSYWVSNTSFFIQGADGNSCYLRPEITYKWIAVWMP